MIRGTAPTTTTIITAVQFVLQGLHDVALHAVVACLEPEGDHGVELVAAVEDDSVEVRLQLYHATPTGVGNADRKSVV